MKSAILLPEAVLHIRIYRQLDYQVEVVGLDFCGSRRLVARYRAAFAALMRDDVSPFRVGLGEDRIHYPAAGVLPVSGIYIDVETAKALGTVIAGGITERKHLEPAIKAGKTAVIFCEDLFFHII